MLFAWFGRVFSAETPRQESAYHKLKMTGGGYLMLDEYEAQNIIVLDVFRSSHVWFCWFLRDPVLSFIAAVPISFLANYLLFLHKHLWAPSASLCTLEVSR